MTFYWISLILFGAACGYQLLAMVLAGRFARRLPKSSPARLRHSLIKPVRDGAPQSLKHIGDFLEVVWDGTSDVYLCSSASGPQEWLAAHPQVTWLKVASDQDINGKASSLGMAQRYWSGDILVVSDADMKVSGEYLQAVLGEFSDPKVGVVTCLYRGACSEFTAGGLLETLCIQDFAASVLVAEKTEGLAFSFGSTMAVRREVLEQIGGFEALSHFLADDYQLGYQAAKAGWKVALAPTMTETDLGRPGLKAAVAHQYRWMVTSRVSRPGGHLAFLLTQGLLWSLILSFWQPLWLLLWICLRIAAGVSQDRSLASPASRGWWSVFLPLKDLVFLALWTTALTGNQVTWGDRRLTIDSDGRIVDSVKL